MLQTENQNKHVIERILVRNCDNFIHGLKITKMFEILSREKNMNEIIFCLITLPAINYYVIGIYISKQHFFYSFSLSLSVDLWERILQAQRLDNRENMNFSCFALSLLATTRLT